MRLFYFATFINGSSSPTVNFEVKNMMEQSRPLDALNKARNKRVIVELKNNKQYIGKLNAFDIHVNIVLDDAEERANG